jgi:serine/threonine-protein kinase
MTTRSLAHEDDLIGCVLLGRYRVVRELAKGGMGVVYLARAEGAVGFVKPVVIKLVLPEHAEDQHFVSMFVREAQILSQLRHPSVVDVLEFGEQDGAYVLVLEYVRGYHLGQWMRYLWTKKRDAPVEILIQIVIDVLEALHHAHNQVHPDGTPMQIVHRDVSPGNILLDEDGRGRLLDFGVARMRGGAGDHYKTQVKGFMGKLPYTAPEVFASADASPRSDLYACAVVLHETLLGYNVFRAENQAATMHKVMHLPPGPTESSRPGVPVGLDVVLAKALAKDPEERYADAREFASALRKLQREQESDIRARLAELLKVDFGREMAQLLNLESLADRDEAWRKLSTRPPRRPGERGDEPSGEVSGGQPAVELTGGSELEATRVQRAGRASLAERTQREAAPAAAARGSQRGMLIGLFLVGGLALGAIALALRPQPVQVQAPAVAPRIRVVTEADPAAAAAPAEVAAPAPAGAAAEEELAPVEPAGDERAEPGRAARGKGGKKRGDAPDRLGLTRAFRKQQPRLEACFKQHAAALEQQRSTQLEFDLDAQGKLVHVGLLPRSLASTALGACLLKIARSTDFPRQGQPVSFAIPITASRGG